MKFENLGLAESLLSAIQAVGYQKPTPIQNSAIPPVLEGRDVLGCAQTGTGKTAAFALPIIQRLSQNKPKRESLLGPRALVLCPTRELAQQIYESFVAYGASSKIRCAVVFGGVGKQLQIRALRRGIDVLVATPGRLLDLMNDGHAGVKAVEILVLDEADRMLDMGFLPDIQRILNRLPRDRQNLLFSATMPSAMKHLADSILHNPVRVEASRVSSAATTIEHRVHFVEKWDKTKLLAKLLATEPHTRTLVFTRTKRGADRLVRDLERHGIQAAALHGDKTQGTRTRVLDDFRVARTPILVATDIAARGLDIDDISHVYNYELSAEPEAYVHRIGRSGRAGATGIAVSLCSIEERSHLRAIERLVGAPLQRAGESAPGEAAVGAGTEAAQTGVASAPSRNLRRRPAGRSRAGAGGRRSRW